MKRLVRALVDNGWGRLGMSLRWLFGTNNVLTALVNDKDLKKIEQRYNVLQKTGFFSGSEEVAHKQGFIRALFAYDAHKANAFSKSLSFVYSWERNSTEPLSLFLDFIRRIFFQGPSAHIYKQTFIESVLHQHEGESNALTDTAWTKNPTSNAESNRLQVLLNALTDAGCFHGEFAANNKQQFLHAVFEPNKKGENALYQALKSRKVFIPKDEDSYPNVTLLLKTLAQIDCSSEANRAICIEGILHVGEYGGVLSKVMWNPSILQEIVILLKNAGCFSNEQYKKAFIEALFAPDSVGSNALSDAACIPESLQITYEYLKEADCFSNSEDKQKLINAMFSLSKSGKSALSYTAAEGTACTQALKMLDKAGCFNGPTGSSNQQAFVNAVFAEDKFERCAIDFSFVSKEPLLKQLNKIHCFEGPFGERNKQALINAVLKPNKLNNSGRLLSNFDFLSFVSLIEHLTAAGCFSGPANNPNKKAFIDAVFTKEKNGKCILSQFNLPKHLILLLEKLADAGCFDETSGRKKFLEAVRSNGNAVVSNSLFDLKSYLALHKCLVQAGCSPQDIKDLLNESVAQEYDYFKKATPLMLAMTRSWKKNDILIARLIHDGAVLTDIQKQQVADHDKKYKKSPKDKEDEVPFDKEKVIADAREQLTAPTKKSDHYNQAPLARRGSFSEHSLFAKKPVKDARWAVDDIGVGLNEKAAVSL